MAKKSLELLMNPWEKNKKIHFNKTLTIQKH